MATIRLPRDFKEFLLLLNSAQVEYLVVGGYAVTFYGYPRATGDLDIWIGVNPASANALSDVLRQFGFSKEAARPELFLSPDKIIRMGDPPMRIELLTGVSGVDFDSCFGRRVVHEIDGILVSVISLPDLKANKIAAGRAKDVADVDNLP